MKNRRDKTIALIAAVAITTPAMAQQKGIVVLDPSGSEACSIGGTATFGLDYLFVNSDHPQALVSNGSTKVLSPVVEVVGGASLKNFSGTLTTGVDAITDPLGELPEPTWDANLDFGSANAVPHERIFIEPGFYSEGLQVPAHATIVCQPGVYVLDGVGLSVMGGGILVSDGAVFFITGSGSIDIQGGASVLVHPPANGDYKGICFFQARSNTNDAAFGGNGGIGIGGAVYIPSATLTIAGGSDLGVDVGAVGDLIVANRLVIAGTGSITVGDSGFRLPYFATYQLYD